MKMTRSLCKEEVASYLEQFYCRRVITISYTRVDLGCLAHGELAVGVDGYESTSAIVD